MDIRDIHVEYKLSLPINPEEYPLTADNPITFIGEIKLCETGKHYCMTIKGHRQDGTSFNPKNNVQVYDPVLPPIEKAKDDLLSNALQTMERLSRE